VAVKQENHSFTDLAYRASILHFAHNTLSAQQEHCYFEDGLLVTRNDKILFTGDYKTNINQYDNLVLKDYSGKLIVPGFIDSHLHFPQTEMLASFGEQLLDWLTDYTFPVERKFADDEYAAAIAKIFMAQLHRHGKTTGMVYSSVHKGATDALFAEAAKHKMLFIAGKVCMDRHCPEWLQDTPKSAQQDSAALIERWHGQDRLKYAITPRFAPTSSPQQLAALGELAQQYRDVFIQTHLSENHQEIAWVKSLFPNRKSYLDVYDHYGLVRKGAVFGHGIHLQPSEWQTLAQTQASIAFCPTSNLFLGSGLFDLAHAQQQNVPVLLATDVGGGTSFSMLKTLGEAYKVCQLKGQQMDPMQGFYMMTQGAAAGLGLEDQIGNLNAGTDADFVILDPEFDELSQLRFKHHRSIQDIIFALSMLADDRAIFATYIAGNEVYNADRHNKKEQHNVA
jgi:guanine deaminase